MGIILTPIPKRLSGGSFRVQQRVFSEDEQAGKAKFLISVCCHVAVTHLCICDPICLTECLASI